jgi:hypothetical protein
MRARTFSDDSDSSDTKEPDYHFDGFDVEFSVKIALMPPSPPKAARESARRDAK